MSRVVAAMLVGALLWAPVRARADRAETSEVRAMLSAYERGPAPETWRALGPETLEALVALYNDTSQPRYVRLRAVSAAGHFPSRASRTFLLAVARTPGQYDLMVRQAVKALERAFGAKMVPEIRSFLDHDATAVREAAAASLGRIGTGAASRALRARLEHEPSALVREAIHDALQHAQ